MSNPLYTPHKGGPPWHLRDNVPQEIYDELNRRFKEQWNLEQVDRIGAARVAAGLDASSTRK